MNVLVGAICNCWLNIDVGEVTMMGADGGLNQAGCVESLQY